MIGKVNGYGGSPNHGNPPPTAEDEALIVVGIGCLTAIVAGVLAAAAASGAVLVALSHAGAIGPWGMIVGGPVLVGSFAVVVGFVWGVRRSMANRVKDAKKGVGDVDGGV